MRGKQNPQLRQQESEGVIPECRPVEADSVAAGRRGVTTSHREGGKVAQWMAVGLLAAIGLLYAGLVPLGQWQADEYDGFSRLNQSIWQMFAARMLWTLRPWEALFVGYGLLVNRLHQPLTGWFLGALWAGFLFCACATAIGGQGRRRLAVLLSGLALAVAFLTSGPLYQLFYWPVATVVYLPILSATLLLFVQTLWGRQSSRRGRLVSGACLVAAALGGELGATFVICYAMLQALAAFWFRKKASEVGKGRHSLYWLLPGLLAMSVMGVASMHRLTASEGFFTVASPQLHHPVASAVAALRSLALEVVGLDANTANKWLVVPRVLSRLLLAIGVALVWARSAGDREARGTDSRNQMVVTGAAFLVASLAVLFGGYLHFGTSTGERLETLRRGWILMAYVAAAVVTVRWGAMQRMSQARSVAIFAPVLIIAGVMMPWHVSPLVRQYETYNNTACTTARNFDSGLQPDSAAMTLVLLPTHGVITPLGLEPGEYTRGVQGDSFKEAYAQYVLEYFGKQNLTVVANRPCRPIATGQPGP
jgi:hypothetical protein